MAHRDIGTLKKHADTRAIVNGKSKARVAKANLAGIVDWGHDSDGESANHDVLRDFH